ncbi:protein phosphatase 2C domain-containing protein [Saccharopolyspora erythraea]|uniref:protein phosphatase 2C domain-containing protein n=1 Tax=Saccharopolyspora erythraea TaxID=1836 RepID=UPI001BA4D0EA|nr:protein phosphatase 2C domain-containing protein [Saccharopolyspora erythraea]QUH00369.1 protein phosphatase 2C domain-containing protein [Saccharopolyspora erythraea]
MDVTYAIEPAPDRGPGEGNEDFVVAGPSWVLVLDGATAPAGVDSGCVHDVRWLVRHLAAGLAKSLSLQSESLADALAGAIGMTCDAHGGTCDLGNPSSPSSTVSVVRLRGHELEYLVLADSPVLLEVGGEVRAIVDDRLDRLPSRSPEAVRDSRNQPGGFWAASTAPEAAYQAVRGSVPVADVRIGAVLTDGASRYVERFGLTDWTGLLDLLEREGPGELINRVRKAENTIERERGKRHDDATAAVLRMS